jgi:ribonuclease HI
MVLKVFFDGGCRPNPGPIEVAVVARGRMRFFDDVGTGSSNDAEWAALCLALEVAQALGEKDFDLVGDSRGIIEQASGAAVCRRPSARVHLARYQALCVVAAPRRLRWTPRQQNPAGLALARRQNLARHDVVTGFG